MLNARKDCETTDGNYLGVLQSSLNFVIYWMATIN